MPAPKVHAQLGGEVGQESQHQDEVIVGKDNVDEDSANESLMLELVDKFLSQVLPPVVPTSTRTKPQDQSHGHESQGETVVLSGGTGSSGALILDYLTRRPSVERVICLSRASSDAESLSHLQASLKLRKRVLAPEALSKVLSFAADVNNSNRLGLSPDKYEMIRTSATAIIHIEWPVNFHLSLSSFEPDIGGVVNLVNLAQTSAREVRPVVFFSSTTGTIQEDQRYVGKVCPEVFMSDPATATKNGYARSKWVVERMLQRAAEEKHARVGVLRVGQLVGDSELGIWNEAEAFPQLFRSVETIKALPLLDDGSLSWLPVNLAASAIADLVLAAGRDTAQSGTGYAQVYHVLNPLEGKWHDVLDGLKHGGLKFETLERREWLRRVAQSGSDVAKHPTIKLLSQDAGRAKGMDFSRSVAASLSPTIANAEPPTPELVALWVKSWRETGFLQ